MNGEYELRNDYIVRNSVKKIKIWGGKIFIAASSHNSSLNDPQVSSQCNLNVSFQWFLEIIS